MDASCVKACKESTLFVNKHIYFLTSKACFCTGFYITDGNILVPVSQW